MSRPELTGNAALFYNDKESRKYNSSSRMINVQREITVRSLELLRLKNLNEESSYEDEDDNNDDNSDISAAENSNRSTPALVLDIGCGSGLSGKVIEEYGHYWIGCDISKDMLSVAHERQQYDQKEYFEAKQQLQQGKKGTGSSSSNEVKKSTKRSSSFNDDNDDMQVDDIDNNEGGSSEVDDDDSTMSSSPSPAVVGGDLLHHDMGTGLPFRSGTFDAVISISALQWLCYTNNNSHDPRRRLLRFFSSLYTILKRTGRAVLQFYPETSEQAVLISETATRVGFSGGVVVDYPNSAKAKKHYLVLSMDKSAAATTAAKKRRQIEQQSKQQGGRASSSGRQQHVPVIGDEGKTFGKNNNKKKSAPVRKKKGGIKTKEWILHKKETQRKRGKDVRPDTKYTARRRPHKF